MSYLWIFLVAALAIITKGQDGFDLSDALDDDSPTKAPIPKRPEEPKKPSGGDMDLLDALGPEPVPPAPKDPKAPAGGGFDLSDALGPDPEPKKPAVKPPKSGGTGGGDFGDSDLLDVVDSGSDYKPDKGKGGGRVQDPSYDVSGGGGEEHQEAGSINMSGILSIVGVAIVGAVSSYYGYKKRQTCFNLQGGRGGMTSRDRYGPNAGRSGGQSNRNVLSNLLRLV
ncbi:CD99 antigen-like protein 2 isoform X1 [Megalops cyprinoides]|uniref:CD99 antigen-like protein 2 isoform X1 n=1 Tax=Megalops cyprinoides TaxID=118141 RepID=UPI001864DCF7|nr:CD99 antigen-like protein 2 isoform X1 [Megalops cyprinoides]